MSMKKVRGVEIDHRIMFGKPVIAGTRIPVEVILDKLEAGETVREILRDYPRLTETDIKAVLSYAKNKVKKVSSAHSHEPATLHKISG